MATIDFLRKFTAATPASCDQEHIPLIVYFCSYIPDRTKALSGLGPSPLPDLVKAARDIEQSGADALVIPCNTAHAWYEQVLNSLSIPVIHIVDAAVDSIPLALRTNPIGLLATAGTLASGIYEARRPDILWVKPNQSVIENQVMPAIRAVKRNDMVAARVHFESALESVRAMGAEVVVLGCTELPLASEGVSSRAMLVDATNALAHMAVRWALSSRHEIPETAN